MGGRRFIATFPARQNVVIVHLEVALVTLESFGSVKITHLHIIFLHVSKFVIHLCNAKNLADWYFHGVQNINIDYTKN